MAVSDSKMEAPAALKWPLARWGNEREREWEWVSEWGVNEEEEEGVSHFDVLF